MAQLLHDEKWPLSGTTSLRVNGSGFDDSWRAEVDARQDPGPQPPGAYPPADTYCADGTPGWWIWRGWSEQAHSLVAGVMHIIKLPDGYDEMSIEVAQGALDYAAQMATGYRGITVHSVESV